MCLPTAAQFANRRSVCLSLRGRVGPRPNACRVVPTASRMGSDFRYSVTQTEYSMLWATCVHSGNRCCASMARNPLQTVVYILERRLFGWRFEKKAHIGKILRQTITCTAALTDVLPQTLFNKYSSTIIQQPFISLNNEVHERNQRYQWERYLAHQWD